MILSYMAKPAKSHGFPNQILHFFPSDLREQVSRHPLGIGLHITHIGWFPKARGHFFHRPAGASESILIFCAHGRGWFELDGRRQSLGPDEAILIPAQTLHSYGADEKDPWSIHWVHFAGNASVCYGSSLRIGDVLRTAPASSKPLQHLFFECSNELANGITLRSILLISHVLRHILGILFLTESIPTKNSSKTLAHDLTKSIRLMRENLHRTVTLRELAQNLSLSPARFSALFRERMGIPPVEHHIRLRIQSACHELDATSSSIKEIASQLGYDDPYYFSRIFRKIIGISPLAYRRSLKG